jgi:ubiquinone/menaquinone biosynthesis C-methylase UbiE
MWAQNFAASTRVTSWKMMRMRRTYEARLIERHVARGATILDAGCGFGEWVTYLAARGFHGIGCDYSPELIRRLRETYPDGNWVESDIRTLPFDDASIDAVISWGVIEHDEAGPGAALREFHRILRPGGYAIVTVPVDSRLARKSAETLHRIPGSEHAFFQYLMSPEELRREGVAAGFETVESGSLPSAHIAHVAPTLSRGLPSAVYRIANFAVYLLLSSLERYRVMIFAVLQKPL